MRGRRRKAVYKAMERLTMLNGRPPCRKELVRFLDEKWADTSQIGRCLANLASEGLVQNVGGGHYILLKTDDGRRIEYLCAIDCKHVSPSSL